MSSQENKEIAASYIMNFNQTIMELTGAYNRYKILTTRMIRLHGNIEESQFHRLEETEREEYDSAITNAHFFLTQAHLMLCALEESKNIVIEEKTYEQVKQLYDSISSVYVFSTKEIELYLKEIHKILLGKVIQDLLQTSQQYYTSVYKGLNNAKQPSD